MEVSRALLLALVVSLSFHCSCVHGRTHHHKRHKHRSIALPPAADPPLTDPPAPSPGADPPAPPPEGKEPVTDPPALPPVAFPPAPSPPGKEPPVPPPQPPPRPGPSAGPPGKEPPPRPGPSAGPSGKEPPPPAHQPPPRPGTSAGPPGKEPPAPAPQPPPRRGPSAGPPGKGPPAPAPRPPPRPGPSAGPPGKEPPAPAPQPPPSPGPSVSPSNNTNVFDVRSFGATGDGVTDDTQAFKLAWVAACRADSGTLLAPRGYSFMINSAIFLGPCQGGITFQVEGSIMPPDGPDSWPANNSRRQWLVFYRADGLVMRGGGLIDGRGEKWWNLPCKPHRGVNGTTSPGPCDSPVALRFFQSSNLTVHGLKIRNSPQFHFRFDNCKNVIVDSIAINSPANSPNTDGIHVENSNSVGIYNSVISNGDDCISIGAGSFNIDIYNITCGPSHGISIGSLGKLNSRACVTNITVNKATIRHSDNGVRIKTWQGGMGSVSSVAFENIHMDNVRNPIIIDQYYCLTKSCPNQTAAVYVSDISYTGIKGTYDVRSRPMHFGCSDAVPCTNITLTDVELLPAVGDVILDPFCWSAYGGSPSLTIPPISCLMEGLPRAIMESDMERC